MSQNVTKCHKVDSLISTTRTGGSAALLRGDVPDGAVPASRAVGALWREQRQVVRVRVRDVSEEGAAEFACIEKNTYYYLENGLD